MNIPTVIADGERMLGQLGVGPPTYIVDVIHGRDVRLSQFEEEYTDATCAAFTSPICDLLLKDGQLRYRWQGRGFCMVFVRSVYSMSRARTLGLILHEAAHWVANCDRPERDDHNHERAIRRFRKTGIDQKTCHGRRWLRASVNLWFRAVGFGYQVSIADVVDLREYDYAPKDLTPLLAEARAREREPVEQILRSPMPGKSRKRTPARAPSSRRVEPLRAERRRKTAIRAKRSKLHATFVRGKLITMENGVTKIDGHKASQEEVDALFCRKRRRIA